MKLAVIALLLVPAIASATPTQTLADVQASYAAMTQVQASFTQLFTNTTFGKKSPSRGKVMLVRPDKMRWEYIDAKGSVAKSIIFDSKTLWVVEPKNKQVYEHTVVDPTLPAAISFLNGAKLTADFDVTLPKPDTLVLVPKKPSAQIKKLTFVIDPKTKQVVKSIVQNHEDHTNEFEFVKVDSKTKIDVKTFEFSPKRVPTYKLIKV